MLEGRETLRSIEKALADLERQEGEIQSRLHERKAKLGKLMTERVGLFRTLAELRAKSAVADGIINEADRLSDQVANLLRARQESVDTLQTRHDQSIEAQKELLAANEAHLNTISDLEVKLDRAAEQAKAQLAGTSPYKEEKAALDKAQNIYVHADAKTKQAHENRVTKGKAYEDDILFMYLWQRQYGRKAYDASGVIRYLDGMVADLVGYHDARANYAVLLEIPERLDDHLKKLAEDVAAAQKKVDVLEAGKIREIAGVDLQTALKQARDELAASNKALEKLRSEIAETTHQLALYAEGRDPSFRNAVDQAAQFLERTELARLRALARHTVSPSDDEVVMQISDIDSAVAGIHREDERDGKRLSNLLAKKQELMNLAADFRRNHYQEPGSVFLPEGNFDGLLEEVIRGTITGIDYWARSRRAQRWKSRPADPYRRSSGYPGTGGLDFGLGGGSGGGGRDDGRDFSTGGGF